MRREDDSVTRWVANRWREPHADDPDLFFAMFVLCPLPCLTPWPLPSTGTAARARFSGRVTALLIRKMAGPRLSGGDASVSSDVSNSTQFYFRPV